MSQGRVDSMIPGSGFSLFERCGICCCCPAVPTGNSHKVMRLFQKWCPGPIWWWDGTEEEWNINLPGNATVMQNLNPNKPKDLIISSDRTFHIYTQFNLHIVTAVTQYHFYSIYRIRVAKIARFTIITRCTRIVRFTKKTWHDLSERNLHKRC